MPKPTRAVKTLFIRAKQHWGVLACVVLVLAGISASSYAALRTQQSLTISLKDRQAVSPEGPLIVDLGQEVAPGFTATISPSVPGSWQKKQSLLGVSSLSFRPHKRFEAGRIYSIRLSHLKRSITSAAIPQIDSTFAILPPPDIKATIPAYNARNVPVDTRFTITLTSANHGLRRLVSSLQPSIPLKQIPSADGQTYTWIAQQPLKQGTAYTFAIDDTYITQSEKRRLVSVAFITAPEPDIHSARTGGYFSPGQTVDIVFDQPMTPSENAFEFDVGGRGSWADVSTYRFKPEGLKPGTTYNYKVKPGIRSKAGGVLETERTFQFSTTGAVRASISPTRGGSPVSSVIRVMFDQAVDHASAESHFSLSPATTGSMSWSGNTLVFKPSSLAYQTSYTVSIAPGVTPVWGLPNPQVLGASFTTENQIVKLGVPLYAQQFPMTCEVASLRMLLAYRGVMVSELDILAHLNYNPRFRDYSTNTWDNPNEMYVGSINGRTWSEGYGVHAGPLANAAHAFGHSATAQFGVSAAFIASNVYAGNPVAVWGHITPSRADAWNTSSGVVQTTTSMHGRVVYGVEGPASNPAGFYINDPWHAQNFYWTASQLMANMNVVPGVSNQAVVVY